MTTVKDNQLHIIIDSSNPQEQLGDLVQALGKSVQWYSCLEQREETDDRHLNTIGRLIEQLAPSA